MVLLDLSAAFDTVDHQLLLTSLSDTIGIRGDALKWIKSYLHGRSQAVTIEGKNSQKYPLECGVPQGSVLGPILFTLYTLPLGDIVRRHGVSFHLYADDTQLYFTFQPDLTSSLQAKSIIEACVSDVKSWMTKHFLKLNADKTEFLIIHSKYQKFGLDSPISLHLDNSEIFPVPSVRNIGAVFDSVFSMEDHVNSMCRAAYLHIRNIWSIRSYLTKEATLCLVHAFITSKLDHLNALLSGLPVSLLAKVQRIQNVAARIVSQSRRSDRITPVLYSLHWLPVQERINFKINLLTYKALNGLAPQYLSDLLEVYIPSRPLRSADSGRLTIPVARTKRYGDRAFSVVAPRLWNKLPVEVKSCQSVELFKQRLKTHLFASYFNSRI